MWHIIYVSLCFWVVCMCGTLKTRPRFQDVFSFSWMYMYNRWSIIYICFIYIEHFFYITYYYGILGNGRGWAAESEYFRTVDKLCVKFDDCNIELLTFENSFVGFAPNGISVKWQLARSHSILLWKHTHCRVCLSLLWPWTPNVHV